jgi:hypothetical protein
MYSRIASIALITAVIACPLLCRNGRCEGCCVEKQSVASTCPASEEATGCCPSPTQDDQRPCGRAPDATGCQGVCGGAVLEKSSSFPKPTEMRFRYEFNAHPSPPASLLADRQAYTVVRSFDGSMTPGRYIRILHMSFLC